MAFRWSQAWPPVSCTRCTSETTSFCRPHHVFVVRSRPEPPCRGLSGADPGWWCLLWSWLGLGHRPGGGRNALSSCSCGRGWWPEPHRGPERDSHPRGAHRAQVWVLALPTLGVLPGASATPSGWQLSLHPWAREPLPDTCPAHPEPAPLPLSHPCFRASAEPGGPSPVPLSAAVGPTASPGRLSGPSVPPGPLTAWLWVPFPCLTPGPRPQLLAVGLASCG